MVFFLWEYFKIKMKKIGPLERMLHCVKIDKLKINDPVHSENIYIDIYVYISSGIYFQDVFRSEIPAVPESCTMVLMKVATNRKC